jgi:hypothetical protein
MISFLRVAGAAVVCRTLVCFPEAQNGDRPPRFLPGRRGVRRAS